MIAPLGPTAASALPQVERSALPREVREGGEEAVTAFRSALGFERMLLVELLGSLAPERDGETGDAASAAYRDLLPETLADAVVARGGLGLATELHRSLREEAR